MQKGIWQEVEKERKENKENVKLWHLDLHHNWSSTAFSLRNRYLFSFLLFVFLAGLFCNRTFDRYACWPDTPAGSVVNISCPFYLPWYDKGKSHFQWVYLWQNTKLKYKYVPVSFQEVELSCWVCFWRVAMSVGQSVGQLLRPSVQSKISQWIRVKWKSSPKLYIYIPTTGTKNESKAYSV